MAKARRNKKRNRMRIITVLFCVILVLALASAGLITYLRRQTVPAADPNGVFSLKEITVTGNNHYQDEAIIGESGLSVGQNVFSINKAAAKKKIEATFPYVHTAQVKSPSFNTIEIIITETELLGAMYGNGQWLIVGQNGKILETMPMESDRPGRYFYLQGAVPAGESVPGAVAMDERSLNIANTVLNAASEYGLDGLLGIDMRDTNDIAINWKNQLTVLLGNESNLEAEIHLLVQTLPHILEQNGNSVSGKLDLSSYSDSTDSNDKIIYTPEDVLQNRVIF